MKSLQRIGSSIVAAVAATTLVAPAQAGAPQAPQATTTYGDPVTGIPAPCPSQHPYPTGATPAQVRSRLGSTFGIGVVGPGWDTPANAPLVRIVWQTLDALSCTSYLPTIKRANPHFTLNAAPISGYAWGDWGLTRPGAVTLDLGKWQQAHHDGDDGRLVRILVHEMGHAYSQTPTAQAAYARFGMLYAHTGNFGPYAHDVNENFSEIVGYYVARCAKDNPYDAKANRGGKFDAYYALVKQSVFAGREFATAPGHAVDCSLRPVVTRDPKEKLDAPRTPGAVLQP